MSLFNAASCYAGPSVLTYCAMVESCNHARVHYIYLIGKKGKRKPHHEINSFHNVEYVNAF